jgi:hypothetical protein
VINPFTPVPTSPETRKILIALYQRRNEGVILRRAQASIGEWKPQAHYCFQNVDAWVRFKPEHKRVDGYVYFDFCLFGFVRFVPHAVIAVEDGTLVDITPHGALDDHPFIQHTGTTEEFLALQTEQRLGIGLDLIF